MSVGQRRHIRRSGEPVWGPLRKAGRAFVTLALEFGWFSPLLDKARRRRGEAACRMGGSHAVAGGARERCRARSFGR